MNDMYILGVCAAFAFMFGTIVASFLNVCIWRLPRNESVVRPGSHCPNCNAPIRWYQNIPILSYLALRGKCASCHKPISPRYASVELLGGMLFLLVFLQWGMPGFLGMTSFADVRVVPILWLVVSGLILGSFIDLEHFYLPDRVTIGGMILGVPFSVWVPELQGLPTAAHLESLIWSAIGLVFGFGFLWSIGWIFSKLFKKDALGFGDVKLLGAVGAFFGPFAVLFTIVISSLLGAVVGLLLIARGKARLGGYTAVPYGPFIALAVLIWIYWGPVLLDAYLKLMKG